MSYLRLICEVNKGLAVKIDTIFAGNEFSDRKLVYFAVFKFLELRTTIIARSLGLTVIMFLAFQQKAAYNLT